MSRPARPAATTIAALLAAATAACSDAPTGPAPGATTAAAPAAAKAEGPGASLLPSGSGPVVTYELRQTDGAAVSGSTVRFSIEAPLKPVSKTVVDNDSADADKRVGYYQVTLPYTGGKAVRAEEVALHPMYYEYLATTPWTATQGATTSLGYRTVWRRPVVTLQLESTLGGPTGGGAVFGAPAGPNPYDMWRDVADGGAYDYDRRPGFIKFYVVREDVNFEFCETKAPTGYRFTSPACLVTGKMAYESTRNFVLKHAPTLKF